MARIEARQRARGAYLARARQGAEAIGRDVIALREAGMTVSEVARQVGIPRPTLQEFLTAAEKAGPAPMPAPPAKPLPVLSEGELVGAVRDGGPIVEIIASFCETDVLFMSREPFARFANPDWGHGMRIPHLMLLLEEAGWVGVDNATVGYGGTGPSNAHRALVAVGIDDDLASAIAFDNRVSRVVFDEAGVPKFLEAGTQWPRLGLSVPEPFGENRDRFRVKVLIGDRGRGCDDDVFAGGGDSMDGFYPSPPDDLTLTQRWLRFLDSPPAWMPPPARRGGTLFTSLSTAAEAGFRDGSQTGPVHMESPTSTYQLIIEQGPVQLWITAYTSPDPSVWVPVEFHDVLSEAGLLPQYAVAADAASTLRKLVSRHRNRRPASITLGAEHAQLP
ncbi:MAG: hypothetical protein WA988_10415 [Candidatus Nanopelagicales bacterium]